MKTKTTTSEIMVNAVDDKPIDAAFKPALNVDTVKEHLLQKYNSRRGRQLYIRFPNKIPETEAVLLQQAKALSSLVVKVHKPRQRHARFCLVDFQSTEDRDKVYKELKTAISNKALAKHMVHIPRYESEEFLSCLATRRLKSIENRKAKLRLKRAIKKSSQLAKINQQHTTSIIIHNLPASITVDILRDHFPNAVDMHIKHGKGQLKGTNITAAVTLPTTQDAHEAVKSKLCICGKPVKINYDSKPQENPKKFKKTK